MEINWLENKLNHNKIRAIGILFIPIALYFIPISLLNEHQSICLFKLLTGHECWGCGITRAVISGIQFQFDDAVNYNKLFVVVFPLLIFLWIKNLIIEFKKI
ncbi:MAG: DUF2752 domain-containing protein [Bacteroidota bacterium]